MRARAHARERYKSILRETHEKYLWKYSSQVKIAKSRTPRNNEPNSETQTERICDIYVYTKREENHVCKQNCYVFTIGTTSLRDASFAQIESNRFVCLQISMTQICRNIDILIYTHTRARK